MPLAPKHPAHSPVFGGLHPLWVFRPLFLLFWYPFAVWSALLKQPLSLRGLAL